MLAIASCAGGGGSSQGTDPGAVPTDTGEVGITVRWPERGEVGSRLIPSAAEAVMVRALDPVTGQDLGNSPLAIARPSVAGTTSRGTIKPLPVGDVRFVVTAQPEASGDGIAQAMGEQTMAIHHGVNAPLGITMSTTITRVEVTPASVSVYPNCRAALSVAAYDAENSIVLVAGSAWQWSSGDTGLATVATDGTVTGVASGEVTISVQEPESGIAGARAITVIPTGLADTPWPTARQNLQRTACSPYAGVDTPTLLWWTGIWYARGSVSLASDGTVYVPSTTKVVAHERNGIVDWEIGGLCQYPAQPSIGLDGTLYCGNTYHIGDVAYALTPGGPPQWVFGQRGLTPPGIGADGTLYWGFADEYVRALLPDGTEAWSLDPPGSTPSGPALAEDGTQYYVTADGYMDAVTADGDLLWSRLLTSGSTNPVIAPDGRIYTTTSAGYLHAVAPNGVELWRLDLGAAVPSPALALDGTIYVACADWKLYAIDPTGAVQWELLAGGAISSLPVTDVDGVVYFGALDKKAYAVNADGSPKWTFDLNEAPVSEIVIDSDGRLYIRGDNDSLFAVGT